MTALYTTALAVGTTAAAGLTVPFGDLGGGWRTGLGSWALFSAAGVLPWLPTLRNDRPDRSIKRGLATMSLVRSRLAWTLTLMFAFQSVQAYIAFGWFAKFFASHGISDSTAGWLLAVFAGVQIPVSMAAPNLTTRHARPLIVTLTSCALLAYLGLVFAPIGGSWLWMALAGIGGGIFPVALTLIGLRSRSAETTAALSAFVQSIGYIVAGIGPLLFGVMHGLTGGWTLSLAILFIALAISAVAGWISAAPRYVDDELPSR
jgi:CP family cyanate transporter-like MFS transporter